MTRFRDFGTGGAVEVEAPKFAIHGEEFICVPQVQGKVLLNLVADSSNTDDPAVSARIITEFFDYVLEDESLTRFNSLLEDKKRIVTVETLGDITSWLLEEYTNRPEEQPERS